jgi:tetratricopeptide (TPR) repeat protein
MILLLTFVVYSPSLANGFTYDDSQYVSTNRGGDRNLMVEELRPFSEYFEREMGYNGVEPVSRGFRPITVYSYAVLHALSKSGDKRQPTGYEERAWLQHTVNVLLHVLATWLVFLIVSSVTGPGLPPLLGALAFGLQALHSDVVASMVGRGELLPFVFGATGLLLYVRAAKLRGGARVLRLVGVAGMLLLAFCSKESAISWCVFVPLFAWTCAWGRDPDRGLFRVLLLQRGTIWAIALPVVIWLALYVRFLGMLDTTFEVAYEFNPLFYVPFMERLPVAVMILGYGLSKVFFSLMLACDYGLTVFPTDVGWTDWRFLLALVFILAMLGTGLAFARRHPLLFLAAAALLGFSFVTSNIPVPIETIFGERLYFAPSLGLCFLVAWLGKHPPASAVSRKVLIGVFVAWCLWGAKWCVQRSIHWHSNDSLMLTDVEHQPESLSINKQVAVYWKDKDPAKWMEYQQRCLALDKHYIMVLNDLGVHHLSRGDFRKAKEYLDTALEALDLRPRYLRTQGDVVHLNVGRWQLITGNRAQAKESFETSRRLNVHNLHTRSHLLMMAHEDRDEVVAAELLADFQRYQPNNSRFVLHRGLAAWRRGDWNATCLDLNEAVTKHGLGRSPATLLERWALSALEDSLGRLQLFDDQRRVLGQMLRVFPRSEHAKIQARLRGLQK